MSGRSPRWFTGIKSPTVANFADNTWEQIIKACKKKKIPATWGAGSQKAMTINGTDYLIDIIGLNHDDYADGSGKAPITFQLHDAYIESYSMNASKTNVGGWKECEMRTTHLPALLALMPEEVKNAIREVNKMASDGNKSSTIETVSDKLFLLSEVEIFGSTAYSAAGEGTQYDYYKAGNSKVKNTTVGKATMWWERSPAVDYSQHFCSVTSAGVANANVSTYIRGVPFAFCF